MPAIYICRDVLGYKIKAEAIYCGEDVLVVISGGDQPHIGAVGLAVSIPSLKDSQRQTVSPALLTVPGHKEFRLALEAAEKLSRELKTTVVVSVGIHITEITQRQIRAVEKEVFQLIADLAIKLTDNRISKREGTSC